MIAECHSKLKQKLPQLWISSDDGTLKDFCEDHSGKRGEIPVALVKPKSIKNLSVRKEIIFAEILCALRTRSLLTCLNSMR